MPKRKSKQKTKRRRVTFSYEASTAEEAILMGDFNDWNPEKHPMKNDGKGTWKKTVLLFPGAYEYKFLIDGKWRVDPQNDQTRVNRFGTKNNIVEVTLS
jgi:1,4-alpha-glucan branching enzyme